MIRSGLLTSLLVFQELPVPSLLCCGVVQVNNFLRLLPNNTLMSSFFLTIVVLPLDPFQLPPTTWIGTFFDIQKCLILWTDLSERFCHALLEAGLIHFMDTEFDRLKEVVLNLVSIVLMCIINQ